MASTPTQVCRNEFAAMNIHITALTPTNFQCASGYLLEADSRVATGAVRSIVEVQPRPADGRSPVAGLLDYPGEAAGFLSNQSQRLRDCRRSSADAGAGAESR